MKEQILDREIKHLEFLKPINYWPIEQTLIETEDQGAEDFSKRIIVLLRDEDRIEVDAVLISGKYNSFSEEISFFEEELRDMILVGSKYSRLFKFNIKILHILFQNVSEFFENYQDEEIIVFFLDDLSKEDIKKTLSEIESVNIDLEEIHFFSQINMNQDLPMSIEINHFDFNIEMFLSLVPRRLFGR